MKKVSYFLLISLTLFGCKKAGEFESQHSAGAEMNKNLDKVKMEDRMLIKNGHLEFETKNAETTNTDIKKVVKTYGALITEDDSYENKSRVGYNLIIRVQADRFDSLVTGILKNVQVEKLESKTTSIADVTEEFIDTEARMKIRKESELKLTELLNKARNLTEVLEIQKQLTDLRSEIESVEGRLKYLTDQVAYSTLRVSFYEKVNYSEKFFGAFWSALKNGWEVFLYVLTFLAYLWVVLLVVFLGRWGYKRYKNSKE